MALITVTTKGNFKNTDRFFNRVQRRSYIHGLKKYAEQGVQALAASTPLDTGKTASLWRYSITETDNVITISWSNDHVNKGVNIAVILQLGHGTRNGGWVEGRDYINPSMRPIFDGIAEDAWREVTG